jgi:glycine/D-amino acid oxidase-like deaminating enzyme
MTHSVTRLRDLRAGRAPWCTPDALAVPAERLVAPLKADVVVVGAGITGALVAQALSAMGQSVVVLDRRPPAHGSTAASTALLQFEIDTPLIHLIDAVGFERARRAWLWSQRAVQDLGALVRKHDIACAFRPRRALNLVGDVLGPGDLAEEGRQRSAIGLPSAFVDSAVLRALAGIDREAALISDGAADVDPVRLTAGLLGRALAQGCRVFSPTQQRLTDGRRHGRALWQEARVHRSCPHAQRCGETARGCAVIWALCLLRRCAPVTLLISPARCL